MIEQPGVQVGQSTYCPVSGVVFKVQPGGAHRTVDGKSLHFCCESCARYFETNRAKVTKARNLGPT